MYNQSGTSRNERIAMLICFQLICTKNNPTLMNLVMKKQVLPFLIILIISVFYSCEKGKDSNVDLTLKDFDGNIYKTVQIGAQVWMAENLRTSHYADGTAIQLVEDGAVWDALEMTDKAMCYYNNSTINKDIYGALYTWAAAMNGAASSAASPGSVQGACPDDWHLPSDAEWKELEIYLGMKQDDADRPGFRGTNEGSKLAGDSSLWTDEALENIAAFGTSGFNALPAGYNYNGTFSHLGIGTDFWSSTESGDEYAWIRFLFIYNSDVYRFTENKNNGYSVRCIKD
jgi:uncharacterized protein (TIGR02145 family)